MTATMTIPTTKAALLAYTEEQWRAFVRYTDALPEVEWTEPTDTAGWSVKDHVAHVVVWIRTEIALLRHRGPMPQSLGISEAVWAGGDDPINEEIRQLTIGDAPAAVRAERDRVYRKFVQVVSGLSDDDLARPATDFGFDEAGKSLLTVLNQYNGDHFPEHRGYIARLVTQG